MKKLISPSTVKGTVKAPASKSMAQRALAAALLADGTTILTNLSDSNDVLAATKVIQDLGATVERKGDELHIQGNSQLKTAALNCGEAGLGVRMFSPIAALAGGNMTLTGEGSLLTRPITMVESPLRQLGVDVQTNDGFLPIQLNGKLKGGCAEVDGSTSSQFLTGLLMALPVCENDSELIVEDLKSRPYIDMTLAVLKDFGIKVINHNYERFEIPGNQKYKARRYDIEGDWSGASCLLVAGAIAGEITVTGLNPSSTQADRAMLEALQLSGSNIKLGDNQVTVAKSSLHAFRFDATDCPDLFPALVALASFCEGSTILKGTNRLTHKESNRALTLQEEFGKMQIPIVIGDNEMGISQQAIHGAKVHSHNDHRIAMACAVAGLGASGITEIDIAEAINKSYTGFFDDLQSVVTTIS